MSDQSLMDIIERLRYRFFGKYRGTVTEVDDKTLRIKAKVPAVLGTQATGWCMPCVPYAGNQVGMAFLPEQGAGVWIEFEGGDVSYPIWVGCYWRKGEQPSDATSTVKAIVTASPHKLLFDDKAGTVTISDSNQNSVTFGSDHLQLKRGDSNLQVADSSVSVNDGSFEVTA
jgi:uncharacterized protein involved in type VI secretion and phage assembly